MCVCFLRSRGERLRWAAVCRLAWNCWPGFRGFGRERGIRFGTPRPRSRERPLLSRLQRLRSLVRAAVKGMLRGEAPQLVEERRAQESRPPPAGPPLWLARWLSGRDQNGLSRQRGGHSGASGSSPAARAREPQSGRGRGRPWGGGDGAGGGRPPPPRQAQAPGSVAKHQSPGTTRYTVTVDGRMRTSACPHPQELLQKP